MTSYYARSSRDRRANRSDWSLGGDGLMDMVQRKPEALLLIGAGIALMMREGRGLNFLWSGREASWRGDKRSGVRRYGRMQSRARSFSHAGGAMRHAAESAGQMASRAGEKASDASENMTRYASDMMDRVSDAASSYASSAGRWADDAREGLQDRSHRIAERARSLSEELDEAVQDHPLVLAALGVAVGAALGATLPSTSIENRAMGPASDQLWEAAEGASGRLGEAAEEAYEEAFRTAQDHGLSKRGLKEMARDVGAKFASAATGEEQEKRGSHQQTPSSDGSGGTGARTGHDVPSPSPGAAGAPPPGKSGAQQQS